MSTRLGGGIMGKSKDGKYLINIYKLSTDSKYSTLRISIKEIGQPEKEKK